MRVNGRHAHCGKTVKDFQNFRGRVFRRPAAFDEGEKQRRKASGPGARGQDMDAIDRDHGGAFKPGAALGCVPEPGQADEKGAADMDERHEKEAPRQADRDDADGRGEQRQPND